MGLAPRRREPTQPRELDGGDRLQGMPEPGPRPRLDLDDHGRRAVPRDDVDLADRAPPVAVEDRVALGFEVVDREVLPAATERLRACHAPENAEARSAGGALETTRGHPARLTEL
jgi:hypothetical protein